MQQINFVYRNSKASLFVIGFCLLLLVSACSTKRNTWTRRTFHNLTAHYNVYWNGNESLKKGEEVLLKAAKDDYSKILRVYNYGTTQEAQAVFPDMERAIEKASIGIQKHSMVFGGKEQVKWIDDTYLMMGKAQFYKKDFIAARRLFDFVSTNFDEDPIHFEAELWLAKTYIEMEKYEKAIAQISTLEAQIYDEGFPFNVDKELPVVYADYFLATENYNEALPHLKRALELNNNRYVQTRIHFILGQIYQKNDNMELATKNYAEVVKRNPPFEMEFESRIRMALAYDPTFMDNSQIIKDLKKMASDPKNEEYLDRIYFALAEMAFIDNNDTLGMNYLARSVQYSTNNPFQRSTSALKLADIYFEQPNYAMAQAYYDTATFSLPDDFPDYEFITTKAKLLNEMVMHLETIRTEDSLQQIAAMDSTDLVAYIDQLILKKKQEDRAQQQALNEEIFSNQLISNNNSAPTFNTGGGKWYFYNPSTLSFGYTEFIKTWGNRKLEDNWRITDKRQIFQDVAASNDEKYSGSDTLTPEQDSLMKAANDPENRLYYLKNLPLDDEELKASDDRIMKSLTELGYLYKEGLSDYPLAIDAYEDLFLRYPDNPFKLQSWYALHKMYEEMGDTATAAFYADQIIIDSPESDYAKILQDPDYYLKLKEQINQSAKLYERTYIAFEREQYIRVVSNANRARELFSEDTAMMPKFEYLRAISMGKIDVLDSMYANLDYLVVNYPKSTVTPQAKNLLRWLQIEHGLGKPGDYDESGNKRPEKEFPYKYLPEENHMVMFVIRSDKIKSDPLKVRISDFNKRYYNTQNYKVRSLVLDDNRQLVTIGNFEGSSEAFRYLQALEVNNYVLGGMDKENYHLLPISSSNYPIFYKEKITKDYKEFLDYHYKNQ